MKKDNNVAIEVKNMSKSFKAVYDKAYTLKERLVFWKTTKTERHQVLKNINIDIKKGETVALIGVNGSSKSSVLRAIYGAPKDKSIEDYWFETNVDNVGDDKGDKQKSCFIYGYYNAPARRNVEVIKTRIKKQLHANIS